MPPIIVNVSCRTPEPVACSVRSRGGTGPGPSGDEHPTRGPHKFYRKIKKFNTLPDYGRKFTHLVCTIWNFSVTKTWALCFASVKSVFGSRKIYTYNLRKFAEFFSKLYFRRKSLIGEIFRFLVTAQNMCMIKSIFLILRTSTIRRFFSRFHRVVLDLCLLVQCFGKT